MPRFNVRCCCQPQKILGTMELATSYPHPKLATSKGWTQIELRSFFNGNEMEFAVYSDDRPIEFWRQFASFQEAPSETTDLPLSSG